MNYVQLAEVAAGDGNLSRWREPVTVISDALST
jgi:hypothetical protein